MKQLLLILIFVFALLPVSAKGKRALLIGISEYPSINMIGMSWDDIHGGNDVDLLAPTLKKQGFKITGIKNTQATASNIRTAFKRLAFSTKPGDLIYIHLSGHGQPYEDVNKDEKDGWDEAFVPYDAMRKYKAGMYEGKNHIIDDELNIMLNAIRKKAGPKGFVYLVIDACHAGTVYMGDEDTTIVRGTHDGFSKSNKLFTPKLSAEAKMKIASKTGYSDVCLLEACRSYENDTEIRVNGMFYGPLSYYVNEVIRKKKLTDNIQWVHSVETLMSNLNRQHLVMESTIR